jgi:hypothetical protein
MKETETELKQRERPSRFSERLPTYMWPSVSAPELTLPSWVCKLVGLVEIA